MLKRRFWGIARVLVCILLMMIIAPGAFAAREKISIKITSTSDREMTLSDPIKGDWEFTVGDFKIGFKMEAIKMIAQTSSGGFRITLNNGETFETSGKKAGEISGTGEWGITSLKWGQVKNAEIVTAHETTNGTKDQAKKIPQWKVSSKAGVSLELWDLEKRRNTWEFDFHGFIIQVGTDHLQSVEQLPEDNKFRILFEDGKSFIGNPTKPNVILTGEGPWGKVSIPFAKIAKIIRIGESKKSKTAASKPMGKAKQSEAESEEKLWTLSLKSGEELDIRDVEKNWHFKLQEFSLTVDPARVASIKPLEEPGRFLVDGISLDLESKGKGEAPMLTGMTPYGRIKAPWHLVSQVARTKKRATDTVKIADQMKIESNSGAALIAWDVKPQSVHFGKIAAEEIHWANVQTVSSTPEGFRFQDYEARTITLEGGHLKGLCALGDFLIPVRSIRQIQTWQSTPPSKISSEKTIARSSFGDGLSIDVSRVTIEGEVENDNNWLAGFMELKKEGFCYWAKKDSILNRGFHIEEKRFFTELRGRNEDFEIPGNNVKLKSPLVTLSGKLGSVVQLVPLLTPKTSTAIPQSPLIIKTIDRNGREDDFRAREVWFANYPRFGWTGWYAKSAWPFRWWREKHIDVTRDDDKTNIKVNIDKLSLVQVVGSSYSRKLILKSLKGSELSATHIWEKLNSESKHGPSSWNKEKEGVLLYVKDDLYVFLPFVSVRQISFGWPLQAEPKREQKGKKQ